LDAVIGPDDQKINLFNEFTKQNNGDKKSEYEVITNKAESLDTAIGIDDEKLVQMFGREILDHKENILDEFTGESSKVKENKNREKGDQPVLKAYIESTDQSKWEIQPLPTRTTKSTDLQLKEFPKVSSCTNLLEQWPIDEEVAPTNSDPFLPWIHDVFPTADGKFIQFVAQNKRRCQTGRKKTDIKEFMQPNIALFQHVPVKRLGRSEDGQQRYRLSTHEEADEDGMETRFICRFKPSMEETLSVFNFNYDYNTFRKRYKTTFTKEGFDVHIIWNSQHLFRCPVPESLQDTIRSGSSVFDDYATQFVDLIPIRTPPRYIHPQQFLPPRFGKKEEWNSTAHYGSNHILPRIEDSGRWENIPICKPSLMTYPDEAMNGDISLVQENDRKMAEMALTKEKKNKLIMCTWTSAGFHTRGERTFVNDGQRRLLEWVQFNRLTGVDHIYIYDNSGAISESDSLKPITDLFPGFVTRINWPCKVCNNNKGNTDNKGERSSQYAAESSCRLRFGAHSDWLGAFDTDEYPVPMGSYDSLRHLLDDMDKEDTRIISFASKRAKPRLRYLNPSRTESCDSCLDPSPPKSTTFLEVYNCNFERPPRKNLMPAEKQIYKTDYVLLHFVHYSAITIISAMTEAESIKADFSKYKYRRMYTDAHTRYVNENTEAIMIHAKSITVHETKRWRRQLKNEVVPNCMIGIEYPADKGLMDGKVLALVRKDHLYANCFPVEKIDNYWIPRFKNYSKFEGKV